MKNWKFENEKKSRCEKYDDSRPSFFCCFTVCSKSYLKVKELLIGWLEINNDKWGQVSNHGVRSSSMSSLYQAFYEKWKLRQKRKQTYNLLSIMCTLRAIPVSLVRSPANERLPKSKSVSICRPQRQRIFWAFHCPPSYESRGLGLI